MSDEGDEKKSPTTQTEEKSKADTKKDESPGVKSPVKDASEKKNGDASPAKSKSTPKKDADKSEEENGDKSGEESDDEAPSDNKHWSYVAVGSEDEDNTATLEQPLEVSGKRERTKVERLESQPITSTKEQTPLEIKAGPGIKLGDIPFIEFHLGRTLASDLKTLHHICFARKMVKASHTKKNIRQFSGEPDGKESAEHTKRMGIINRLGLGQVKGVLTILGIEKKGTKSDMVDKLETFMLKPEDSGKKVPEKKKPKSKKRSISKTKSKKSEKGKKEKKEKKKDKSEADEDNDEDNDDDNDDEDNEDQEDNDEEDSDTEAPPPKKKAKVEKKTPKKEKKTPVKEKKSAEKKKKKPTPKKTPKQNGKKSPTKGKDEDMSDLSSDSDDEPLSKLKEPTAPDNNEIKKFVKKTLSSDSDDEPLSKLKEPAAPDNNEIKKFVKKTLEGADLEEVTMKTVVKKVYAKYPAFDLSDRKDFIKSVVRQIIS